MILTDQEVEERLASPLNLVRVIEKSKGGRTKGSTNIPESVRDLIAITNNSSEEKQSDVAKTFEIDSSSVSEISKGLVGGKLDRELSSVGRNARERQEDRVHESALDCLMSSLSSLQPKLADPDLKAKELSRIASDMSRVAANLKPRSSEPSITNNTQVILMRPVKRDLSKYEFIESNT